jgi:DNA (cytosine-5)-methyltransferase 1
MERRPRLLDLFCGAGGASTGYHRAGFDVTGVDIEPMPRYPHKFVQGDATTYPLDGFDAIHASPPCHDHSTLNAVHRIDYGTGWMLAATRERLQAHGAPWVMENVPGAPMIHPLKLCGAELGLTTLMPGTGPVWLRRHRLFESNMFLFGAGGCSCSSKATVGVYGHGAGGARQRVRGPGTAQASRDVMGIDWMNRDELDEATPPAYTEFIGTQLLSYLTDEAR